MGSSNARIFLLKIIIFLLMFVLSARLFYIQIIKGEIYSKRAVEQKIKNIRVGEKRGEIYDRNMIPFTDRTSKDYIYAIPGMIVDKQNSAIIISELTGISFNKIYEDLKSNKSYIKYEIKSKTKSYGNKRLPIGLFELSLPQRYSSDSLARHVTGYIGDKKMGLEQTFDSILSNIDEESVAVFTDGNNVYIRGLGIRLRNASGNSFGIKTTLDYHIQKAVENILDKNNIDGAAVVLDVKSGDILAMASRPNFDQNNIQNYIGSFNEEFINKTTSSYPPGSVFKIIVAAAALEYKKVNLTDKFYCTGSYDINGVVFHDYKGESHGVTDIKKGFALSCNTTFIKIGQITGGEDILKMARKFGVTISDNLPIAEQIGMLPKISDTFGAGIGNLSIGQGDVLITPLQAADIAATVANNGIRHVPNLVKAIVDETGKEIKSLYRKDSYRVISSDTAIVIKQMMRDVVTDGTGKRAETEYGSAGKTGSAEVNKELNIYHAWFTGFVPYDNPKYAISIFVKNGDTGGTKAAPIFKQIVDEIMKY